MQWLSSGDFKIRSALRDATDAVHQRLHQAPPCLAIAEGRLSLAGYADLLRRIASFHLTVTPEPPAEGSRRALLEADLESVGAPPPRPLPWRAPRDRAGRLGSAWVVAGSALGGKVVYRQLDYLFGGSAAGRLFFRGSGGDGARWRALCSRLETEGAEPGAVERMISGAEATFALFERSLEPAAAHG